MDKKTMTVDEFNELCELEEEARENALGEFFFEDHLEGESLDRYKELSKMNWPDFEKAGRIS